MLSSMTLMLSAGLLALGGLHSESKFVAKDASDADRFGASIAASGNTCVVGSYRDDHTGLANAGSAYVFERDPGGVWIQSMKLVASDAAAQDYFGFTVAIEGDVIAVGSLRDDKPGTVNSGSVYLYERDLGGLGAWGQAAKLFSSNAASEDAFGTSVSISGDTLVVGAVGHDNFGLLQSGAAYVFQDQAIGWTEVIILTAPNPADSDYFGQSVSVAGDYLVIGANGTDHSGFFNAPGAAYVFERDLGGVNTWGLAQTLIASDSGPGDWFGVSVAVFATRLAIGATDNTHSGVDSAGAVYIYDRTPSSGVWNETEKLIAGDPGTDDGFGAAVDVLEDRVVVGAPGDDLLGLVDAGAAYVYDKNKGGAGAWGESAKVVASDAGVGDRLGSSVSAPNWITVVGSPWQDHTTLTDAGASYGFEVLPPVGANYCTSGVSASGCRALISGTGQPSTTAPTGFLLSSAVVEGAKDGMFFFGTNGQQAVPWGTGFQCVVPPVKRCGLLSGIGTMPTPAMAHSVRI